MDYLKINRDAWNQRANIHFDSEFYDVKGFLAGGCPLREIELEEMESLAGKRLLHLQCHFGLDTLAWARKGAQVTGVDLSPDAIAKAEQLAEQAGIPATFVCSDVYQFKNQGQQEYDVVFTSYGALGWLPDMDKWAQTVAAHLKPGGHLYLVEFHPFHEWTSGYCYFHNPEPDIEESGTYTENDPGTQFQMATWAHPISDVVNALIAVGIQIEHLKEYPFSPYSCFEDLEEREPGRFYKTLGKHPVPMVYSIKGQKR